MIFGWLGSMPPIAQRAKRPWSRQPQTENDMNDDCDDYYDYENGNGSGEEPTRIITQPPWCRIATIYASGTKSLTIEIE